MVCGPHISEAVGSLGALLDRPPFQPAKPLWDGQDIQPRPVTAASAEAGAGVEDRMPPEIGQAHAASAQGSVPPPVSASKSLDAPHCASSATQPAPASLLLGKPSSSHAAGGSSSAATASDGTVDAMELAQTKQRLELQLKELKLKRLKLLLAQKQKVHTPAPKTRHGSLA